jgi:hypothetical protein
MYFLNYQAGDLLDAARGTPPYTMPKPIGGYKPPWELPRE